MLSGAIAYQVLQQENPVTIDRATEVCRFVLGTALHFSALSGLAYATRNGRCPPAPAWPLCFPRDRQEAEMELTQPHTVAQSFEVFAKQYPSDLVYPIFGLLGRIVLAFPMLESSEAVNGFIWIVGKNQTETVAAETQKLAKRTRDATRLQTPLLRAYRQVLDYYIADVRKDPDDSIEKRIPRWGKKVKTLPIFRGKIDAPQPVLLAWEYDLLLHLCKYIDEEVGLDRWEELANKLRQERSTQPAVPVSWWNKRDKLEYLEVNIPDNATPSQAAYLILATKTRLSVERLRKLVQEGHRLFAAAVLEKVQRRWEKARVDPELGILRIPLEDEKDELILDLEFGFSIEPLFPIGR